MSHTIVTAFTGTEVSSPGVEPNTEPLPHSNTMNVATLPTCEAAGCQSRATQHYTIYEGDTRNLCDECFRLLLRKIRQYHYMRKIQRGVDDLCGTSWESYDSDYEPYYSRADEMADQANADYYDEIARGAA